MAAPILRESAGWRYFTFLYLYIMQGIPSGFALTAIANYLLGQQLTPQQVGSFIAVVGLPWTVQFVWGPLIDKFQHSVIGSRKQWVVLTQLVAFLASLLLLLVRQPAAQLVLLTTVFFAHSIFASIQDASVDAIAIAVVPPTERGRVNAFMRGGYLLGVSFGAAGLAYMLHRFGFFAAALTQSALLLLFTVLTLFIKLERTDRLLPSFRRRRRARFATDNDPAVGWLFRELYRGITERRSLVAFGTIALVYLSIGVFGRAYSFHLIQQLHWPDKDVSILQGSWGSAATMALIITGGIVSDRVGATRLQRWVMFGLAGYFLLFSSLVAYWHYKPVATAGLLLWNLADPCFSVAALPALMALCRLKIEGSQFTTYMALVNFCDVLGAYITGWALGFTTASLLGLVCGSVILTLLVLQPYLSRETPVAEPLASNSRA
ncbi:MFS transporter [Hymenobacter weizhouensis]|uniref:MFS transporter n=1 Tax=Hymenobacter sp. YIM 151500-1 TaxID=2987689 RepID=UPI0022279FB2|nr:MFS transporter [Hymenobacter sp. YIM 151500-1]UYZ64974.1 MFS transporter [Hymenobacter sp. YIM 151500-1]